MLSDVLLNSGDESCHILFPMFALRNLILKPLLIAVSAVHEFESGARPLSCCHQIQSKSGLSRNHNVSHSFEPALVQGILLSSQPFRKDRPCLRVPGSCWQQFQIGFWDQGTFMAFEKIPPFFGEEEKSSLSPHLGPLTIT